MADINGLRLDSCDVAKCRTSLPRLRRAGTEITVSAITARGCGMSSCLAAVTAHERGGALLLWEKAP